MYDNKGKSVRTINAAIKELHEKDPNTAISAWSLRKLVTSGQIPSVRVGSKYLICLEDVVDYYSGELNNAHRAAASTANTGGIRPLPVRVADIDRTRL